MALESVPGYLQMAARHSRPDTLKLDDDDHLQMVVHMCELPLMEWIKDKGFWDYLSLADFGTQEFEVLDHATQGDSSLAKLILAAVANPEDRAERTRRSVETILKHLQQWLHHAEQFGINKDPGTPVRILGDVFKAVSGGIVISGTFITKAPPLSVQAGALASGSGAILEAATSIRKHVVGKKPFVSYE